MLAEERFKLILDILEKRKAVTVVELVEELNTSESTIRRDLIALGNMNKLKKVHGGATLIEGSYNTKEEDFNTKYSLNVEEKKNIGKFAASLIDKDDFVYIDAGTSTDYMVDYIEEKRANYVTNGIAHAKKLVQKGCNVSIIGGQLKISTEAIIGIEAINSLKKYNFTKCFMGVNGIDLKAGFTTPDISEALLKDEAIIRSQKVYVLGDSSKFNRVSSVTFGNLEKATVITSKINEKEFKNNENIVEVENL